MVLLDSLIDVPPLCSTERWKTGEYGLSRHYSPINLSSVRHIDELVRDRCDNPSIQGKTYTTGDFFIYYTQNNLPKLAITRIHHNPLFDLNRIDDLSERLLLSSVWHGVKIPYNKWFWQQRQLQNALNDPQTTILNLTKIRSTYSEGMSDYLCINPKNKTAYFRNFRSYEPEQRVLMEHEHPLRAHYKQSGVYFDYDTCSFSEEDQKLLSRLFGSSDSFDLAMNSLGDAGILYLKIKLMGLKDVMNYTKKHALGHFVSLDSFKNYSDINGVTSSLQILDHNYIRAESK